MAESYAHSGVKNPMVEREPKKEHRVLARIEIRPTMEGGGGHAVDQHFSSMHEMKSRNFKGPHEAVSLPKGHVLAHIAGHMGIPVNAEKATHETEEKLNEDGTE